MAEGFFGYLLPWGNMSYWACPGHRFPRWARFPTLARDALMEWVRGDFLMSRRDAEPASSPCTSSHCRWYLVILVFVHLVALHHVGSNNPDGIEIKKNKGANGIPLDGIAFHPYYTVHDIHAIVVFLAIFCAVVFFAPEMWGYFIEKPNFEAANPLKTPEHIAPVWYYTPFYSMLRAATFPLFGMDAKFWGFVVMGGAIILPAVLPWLDRSPVKSIRYKGTISKVMLGIFVVSFFILGYLGTQSPTDGRTAVAQFCTILYFAYFILMPWYTRVEKTKPEPERVTG